MVLEVFSNVNDPITFPSGSVVSRTFPSFLLPIFILRFASTFLFFIVRCENTFPKLTSEAPFFGYLLTALSASYCNGYNARLMLLLQTCLKSYKIRNVCPYCRDPKPLQGLDLQQIRIPKRYKVKRDVTLKIQWSHTLKWKEPSLCPESTEPHYYLHLTYAPCFLALLSVQITTRPATPIPRC